MTDHTPLTDAELVELRKMLVCSAFGWPVGELEEAVRRYDAVVAEIRRLRDELHARLKMKRPPINVTCPCCERDDECIPECSLHHDALDEWEELEWRRSIARYLDLVEVNAKPAKGK